MDKSNVKVVVACKDSNGCAAMYIANVSVTEEEYFLGTHYELAEEKAEENRYEGPFICFDNEEQSEIFNAAFALTSAHPLNCDTPQFNQIAGYIHRGLLVKAIRDELDLDVNTWDMETLATIGYNTQQKQIVNNEEFSYSLSSQSWESESGQKIEPERETGLPRSLTKSKSLDLS